MTKPRHMPRLFSCVEFVRTDYMPVPPWAPPVAPPVPPEEPPESTAGTLTLILGADAGAAPRYRVNANAATASTATMSTSATAQPAPESEPRSTTTGWPEEVSRRSITVAIVVWEITDNRPWLNLGTGPLKFW